MNLCVLSEIPLVICRTLLLEPSTRKDRTIEINTFNSLIVVIGLIQYAQLIRLWAQQSEVNKIKTFIIRIIEIKGEKGKIFVTSQKEKEHFQELSGRRSLNKRNCVILHIIPRKVLK